MAHRSSALIASRLARGGYRSYRLAEQQQSFGIASIKAFSSNGSGGVRSNEGSTIGIGKLPSARVISRRKGGIINSTIRKKNLSTAAEKGAEVEEIESSVQGYYDDPNALNFHMQAWGGSGDIHIGLYDHLDKDQLKLETRERMKLATRLTTEMFLDKAFANGPSPAGTTVVDMGSGFGSTARAAAREYGCNMVCIEISGGFNAVNREMTAAAGLSDKVTIPGERSFFDTQLPSSSVNTVLSQDSFLHASMEQHRAMKEASRILKPGGVLCFTDLMQTADADASQLAEVYRTVGLSGLATPEIFEEWGKAAGLELVEFDDKFSPNLGYHYQHLVEMSSSLKSQVKGVDDEWFNRMATRYSSWVTADEFKIVKWGVLVFKKKAE